MSTSTLSRLIRRRSQVHKFLLHIPARQGTLAKCRGKRILIK